MANLTKYLHLTLILAIIIGNIGIFQCQLNAKFNDADYTTSTSLIAFSESINFGIHSNSQKIIEILNYLSNENLKLLPYFDKLSKKELILNILTYWNYYSVYDIDVLSNLLTRKTIFPFHFFW